jgi:hypothetical protein
MLMNAILLLSLVLLSGQLYQMAVEVMRVFVILIYGLDRSHGKLYSQQVEDIHKNLTDYVSSVEKEMTDRQRMIELLEQSEIFYDVQYGEAKIVANVWGCVFQALLHFLFIVCLSCKL